MAVKRHHLPVNWVDGMKINREHFIATDRNFTRGLKNAHAQFLNPFNYGIVLQFPDESPSVKLYSDIDNQGFVHVKVLRCQAITPGGIRIDIDNNYFSAEDLSAPLPHLKIEHEHASEKEFYVVLSVNPFGRVPVGQADPEETPPRLPYVIPEYHLSIHQISEKMNIKGENSLIIGKLIMVDHKPEFDESYIPPCQCLYSHPKLAEYHAQLLKILGQIEIDLVDILRSINEKKQSTSIANTVGQLSGTLLIFLGSFLTEFRRSARYYPPVYIFENISAFARIINNSTEQLARADKEEFLNYIVDWSNLKPGDFEDLIKNAIEYEYDHDDINQAIKKIDPFVSAVSKIFNTLSNLDFMGKKKDRQIFVKEQKEKPGSSFLVD